VASEIVFKSVDFIILCHTCNLCWADGTGMVGRIMFAWIQG